MNLTIFLFISTYRKLFHFLVFDSIHNHYRSNLTIWWLFPHCCTFGTLSFFAIPTHSQNTTENCISSRPEHSEHSEMLAGLRSPHDWEFQQRRPETRAATAADKIRNVHHETTLRVQYRQISQDFGFILRKTLHFTLSIYTKSWLDKVGKERVHEN